MNKVSVIIPSFNNARWLSKCIMSCIHQGSRLGEIIVVDDGSIDDSLAVAEQLAADYPLLVKVLRNPGKGGNQARNYGFKHSKEAYIQWLDSDDMILPGKFDAQCTYLDAHTEADIVYSDWRKDFYRLGEQEAYQTEEMKKHSAADYLEELLRNRWTSPNNYILRRSTAEQLHEAKGWNPDTPVEQDREYFTLAGILGAKFAYVSGCFAVYHRWSETTVSGMPFEKRLEWSVKLTYSFLLKLRQASHITPNKLKKYESIIKAEWVKAKYYNKNIVYPEQSGLFMIGIGGYLPIKIFITLLFKK